jgi:microcystin degradation protein MlrC
VCTGGFEPVVGDDVLHLSGSYLGGMVSAANELGWDLTGLLFANTQPSGTIADVAYESMREEILARLRDAMPVDVVGIENHGAGVAGQSSASTGISWPLST